MDVPFRRCRLPAPRGRSPAPCSRWPVQAGAAPTADCVAFGRRPPPLTGFAPRRVRIWVALVAATWVWSPAPQAVRAQDAQDASESAPWHVPRPHNPWARFHQGAWTSLRTVTETLDESGEVTYTSVAVTTTTLTDVTDDGYQLKTEMTVGVDGKRLRSQPQTLPYDFFQQPGAPPTAVRDGGPATVEIDGKEIPCHVYKLDTSSDKGKELTTIHYAEDVSPHVLRRHVLRTDGASGVTIDETSEEVMHLRLRRKVLGTLLWTAEVKTVRQDSKGSTVALAYLCDAIPGGIVDRMSTEFDATGRVVRCTTLELIGFGCESRSIRILPQLRSLPRLRARRVR